MAYLPNWGPVTAAPAGAYYWQTLIAGDGVWYAIAFEQIPMRSADQGVSWQFLDDIPACTLDGGICAADDGSIVYAFAIGLSDTGTIYQSSDNGLTFSALTSTANKRWSSICCSGDGTKLFATQRTGANSSKIAVSLDSGATWTEIDYPTTLLLWINCSADGAKIVVSHNEWPTGQYAYLSTDSGATFSTIPDAVGQKIKACISRDGSTIYLAIWQGDILKSTDDGATWTTVLPAPDPHPIWTGLGCSADGSKVMASAYWGLYTSGDGGASWFKVYENFDMGGFDCNITRAIASDEMTALAGVVDGYPLKGFFLTDPDLSCCCTKWLTQYFPGQPTTEQRMAYFAIPLTVTVPQGFSGSKAVCVTAPDATVTYTIRDPWNDVGTITFATGETTGTFTGPSALELSEGDTLSVIAPSEPDASQSDIAITLVAVCEGNDPPAPSACCNTIRVDMTATATLGVRLTNIQRPRVQLNARAVMMGRLTNA